MASQVKKTVGAAGPPRAPVKAVGEAGVSGVSPLAPKSFPALPPLAGVRLATGQAGIKYRDRTDVLLAVLAPGTQVAGVFTKSKTASAPVEWCRKSLPAEDRPRAGREQRQCQRLHRQGRVSRACARWPNRPPRCAGCRAQEVFLASTGVIGEPLPHDKITTILGELAEAGCGRRLARRGRSHHDHRHVSEARHRDRHDRRHSGDHQRHRQGLGHDRARHGDHARLCFHRCRLCRPPCCRRCSPDGVEHSFNCITVDSDTSTSDTLLLFATGKGARIPPSPSRTTSGWRSSRTGSMPCCSISRIRW